MEDQDSFGSDSQDIKRLTEEMCSAVLDTSFENEPLESIPSFGTTVNGNWADDVDEEETWTEVKKTERSDISNEGRKVYSCPKCGHNVDFRLSEIRYGHFVPCCDSCKEILETADSWAIKCYSCGKNENMYMFKVSQSTFKIRCKSCIDSGKINRRADSTGTPNSNSNNTGGRRRQSEVRDFNSGSNTSNRTARKYENSHTKHQHRKSNNYVPDSGVAKTNVIWNVLREDYE